MNTQDYQVTQALLSLAGEDIPLEAIEKWTPQQRQRAEAWAAKYYLKANDNPTIRVPPKPKFLKTW